MNNGIYKSGSFTQFRRKYINANTGLSCEKVRKVCFDTDGSILAGTENGLFRIKDGSAERILPKKLKGNIGDICIRSDNTYIVAQENILYFISGGVVTKSNDLEDKIVNVREDNNRLWILTESYILCTDKTFDRIILKRELEGGKGLCLAVSGDNIYAATQTNLSVVHGKRMEWKNISSKHSPMPDKRINTMTFDSNGYLWLGFDEGCAIYNNSSFWMTSDEIRSLPKNGVYAIATDDIGNRYFATDSGVICQIKGKLKYLTAERWVQDNRVNDIAVSKDGSLIVAATDKGISVISSFEDTLKSKAAEFEKIIEKYHIRRGFTAARNIINNSYDSGNVIISDNDGLWTACYVTAESLRYASTGEKDALEKARRGLKAMLFLTKITGIKGFTARAVRYPGDEGYGNGDSEWALSPDGSCEWKGETSSDEMTGHFTGYSVYYDLCADKEEKEEIKTAVCNIMDHIIENNYRLIDRDNLPTTWACWDPELLNHSDRWFAERGVNSLELLMFLKVAFHVSGNDKYQKLYDTFIKKHHYLLNIMQHKVQDAHICHIDDNLAFLASFALLRLEENAAIRSYILCGMEDHWQYERIERQPMFCFIHAAFTGRDSDLSEGIQSLREIPLDLIQYAMKNSDRKDIIYDNEQAEYNHKPQIKYPLAYDERNLSRPDGGAFQLDSPRIQQFFFFRIGLQYITN